MTAGPLRAKWQSFVVRGLPGSFGILVLLVALTACGSKALTNPQELLLSPEDFDVPVIVLSMIEEQSPGGPSAQVTLEAPEFKVLQSLVLFESHELALSALDGIRADLVSRGDTGPGEREASGVFQDHLGQEEAASLFFIENNGLVRLSVTGTDRERRLADLAEEAREKLSGS